MMGGNPNWWNPNSCNPPPQPSSSSSSSFVPPVPPPSTMIPPYPSSSLMLNHLINICPWNNDGHDQAVLLPSDSWSQLLLGGLMAAGEDDQQKRNYTSHVKKMENLDHHQMSLLPSASSCNQIITDHQVKQEQNDHDHGSDHVKYFADQYPFHHPKNIDQDHDHHSFQPTRSSSSTTITWKKKQQQQLQYNPVSSPTSCITTYSSNMLDFSNNNREKYRHPSDHSQECNSSASGGAVKKARVQSTNCTSSTTTQEHSSRSFKVIRKEKLGDRITALHQIVSPFGKTDTASVLLEAIGYIRFLHTQITALSSPYMGSSTNGSSNFTQSVQQVGGDPRGGCIFPEDPGQLLNESCMKKKAANDHDHQQAVGDKNVAKDLKSRGLCLVPISCTLQVGSENAADFWAPATFGSGYH